MKLRCDLEVNGGSRRLLICQGPSEPEEHLALRLAAYLMFWDADPVIDASTKTPALADYEFLPDLLVLDDAGEIKVWVECDSVTMNKLQKLTRRLPKHRGRIIVLKPTAYAAQRLREEIAGQLDKPERIEILAFPEGAFKEWATAVGEKTDVVGEASESALNAVVNEVPFSVELSKH